MPKATRVAIIWNVDNVAAARYLAESRAAARSLGLEIQAVEVRAPSDLSTAFDAINRRSGERLHDATRRHAPGTRDPASSNLQQERESQRCSLTKNSRPPGA